MARDAAGNGGDRGLRVFPDGSVGFVGAGAPGSLRVPAKTMPLLAQEMGHPADEPAFTVENAARLLGLRRWRVYAAIAAGELAAYAAAERSRKWVFLADLRAFAAQRVRRAGSADGSAAGSVGSRASAPASASADARVPVHSRSGRVSGGAR